MNDLLPKHISVSEAQAMLGVSERSVYKLLDKGDLVSSKILDRRVIDYQSVIALLEANRVPARAP